MGRQVCLTIPFALMSVFARPAHINRVSPDSVHSSLSKVELKVERFVAVVWPVSRVYVGFN